MCVTNIKPRARILKMLGLVSSITAKRDMIFDEMTVRVENFETQAFQVCIISMCIAWDSELRKLIRRPSDLPRISEMRSF